MSVVPVSDALQRLENEGLVESWPRVGTRVRIPTAQDIRGHYVVREALESQSARLFAQKSTPEERLEIQALARNLDEQYQKANADGLSTEANFDLHRLHQQFHMRVAECGGHPALSKAIERNQILTFNWLYDTATHRNSFPPDHHSRLAQAVSGGDAEAADAAMRQHVIYGREELLRTFQMLYSEDGRRYVRRQELNLEDKP
jgi:GntR family transcriptional regulator, rspAB operon transcriptional repressor